ncbi:MAG: XRE family transcriptional regulator [Alicyclobacillus herbarius]|uniref:helix-turn-helix domain-containing protein n=1 Tax=Alicyclobacillus herbarius TaxID=122960 RepID=UPI002354B7D4|nr:XRE family transcriptional regulator [Alicyclobacillus herbarius]MCL6633273.1 XRE family transcriptional regulator [Alicyclobacillus herbarius]
MDAEKLPLRIGQSLRRLRRQRGWSLDELAAASGVSKPMLGQIERGESNATVVTLWKVAQGLRVPFSALLQDVERPAVTVVRRADQPVVADDEGRYTVQNGLTVPATHPLELYQARLAPLTRHVAEKHGTHVREAIWVLSGKLVLSLLGDTLQLEAGDAAHFIADAPHTYHNPAADMDCTFLMALLYEPAPRPETPPQ